jgi:hypothetical protein
LLRLPHSLFLQPPLYIQWYIPPVGGVHLELELCMDSLNSGCVNPFLTFLHSYANMHTDSVSVVSSVVECDVKWVLEHRSD